MPTTQKHRGAHPKDPGLFNHRKLALLGEAVRDYYFLISRDYGETAALKVVGDRYRLQKRQRFAMQKIVCNSEEIQAITTRKFNKPTLTDEVVYIDGFNLLITVEALLSGGFVFECVDTTFRDIASVHGHYKRVEETQMAIEEVARAFQNLNPIAVTWLLDAPVSNSGRLAKQIEMFAQQANVPWSVSVTGNPDLTLKSVVNGVVVSSDRNIISNCKTWFNLTRYLIDRHNFTSSNIIKLSAFGLKLQDFNPSYG